MDGTKRSAIDDDVDKELLDGISHQLIGLWNEIKTLQPSIQRTQLELEFEFHFNRSFWKHLKRRVFGEALFSLFFQKKILKFIVTGSFILECIFGTNQITAGDIDMIIICDDPKYKAEDVIQIINNSRLDIKAKDSISEYCDLVLFMEDKKVGDCWVLRNRSGVDSILHGFDFGACRNTFDIKDRHLSLYDVDMLLKRKSTMFKVKNKDRIVKYRDVYGFEFVSCSGSSSFPSHLTPEVKKDQGTIQNVCGICYTDPITRVIIPCGHCYCDKCIHKLCQRNLIKCSYCGKETISENVKPILIEASTCKVGKE